VQAESNEKRRQDANNTAFEAIGPRKKRKLEEVPNTASAASRMVIVLNCLLEVTSGILSHDDVPAIIQSGSFKWNFFFNSIVFALMSSLILITINSFKNITRFLNTY
jgi:hypothetical protein